MAACLTISIGNQTFALYIDARLSGNVTHLALQERSYLSMHCF